MTTHVAKSGVNSVLRWFGGKHYLASKIISLFPADYHCYCEPFAGGAHVLTQKAESPVEIYNDLDKNVVNFLMQLRRNRDDLVRALETLPTSRFLFEQWKSEDLPEDPFERAVRWFYLLRNCVVPANGEKSGFRCGKIKNAAADYLHAVQKLEAFEKRFRNVLLECQDARDVIRRYDGENTLLFIDCPYRYREQNYFGGWTDADHCELAELLRTCRSKVLVSYYHDPLIDELYKDWMVHETESWVGNYITNGKRRREVEVFFTNYQPQMLLF